MIIKWFLIGDVEDPNEMASQTVIDWLLESGVEEWLTEMDATPNYSLAASESGIFYYSLWVVTISATMDPELETLYRLKFEGLV